MTEDDKKLNALLTLSTNVDLKEQDELFWYDRKNQKKLTYNLAAQLLLTEDMDVDEAIRISKEFHDKFYKMIIYRK